MNRGIYKLLFVTIFILLSLLAISGTASAQAEGFLTIFAIFSIIIIIFIVFILVAIWVYRDANSRGMSGVLWLIVVLVGSIVGLIVYLVIRKDHPVGSYPTHSINLFGPPPGYYPPPPGYPPPGYPPPGYYPPPGDHYRRPPR